MRSALLLLAILSISSSFASASFCFPRSSRYAVPIIALEAGYELFPSIPKPSNAPPQKPTTPTPKPGAPPVTKPETPPASKPVTPPASKPVTPPTSKPVTPPVSKPVTPPVSKPMTPPVSKPATPPVSKPEKPPASKPATPPSETKKTGSPPPAANSGGSVGGAMDAAFAAVIKSLCAKTNEPDLCFTSIKPLVGAIKVSHDATGVLKLAMEALKRQTDAAIKEAKKYVADPKTNKLAVQALNDCLESYDDATYNLAQVDAALKINDKGTVNSLLSTVGTDYDTCENGFDDFEIKSLMSDFDAKLMKTNSICLAIAKAANLMA